MTRMKLLSALFCIVLTVSAHAQSAGQLDPGQVWGNFTAQRGPASPTALPIGSNSAGGILQCDGVTTTCSDGRIVAISDPAASALSMVALRALAPGAFNVIYLAGYYGPGDPGAGYFIWNSTSTATDNGGTIIQPNAGGAGRWIRVLSGSNLVTPEMFGAKSNGVFDDAAPIRAALSALNTIGNGLLHPGSSTYNMATVGANGAVLNNYPNVSIIGNGANSVFRLANGVITSTGTFVHMIIPPGNTIAQAINNAVYKDFVIDMNGANNSCSGTCFNSNETLGAFYGDNVLVDNVTILNNPGSQGFSFGSTFAAFPTMTDVRIINSHLEKMCDAVNAACTDSSAIWIHAQNGTVANNTIQNCGASKGTGIELHGFNVEATGNSIWNCNIGVIMSSDTGSVATNSSGLTVNGNTINLANTGVSLQVVTGTNSLTYTISNNAIQLNSAAGVVAGIDASSSVSATATTGTLNISGNTITSGLGGTLPNANSFSGIAVQYWAAANITGNIITNIAGPGVYFPGGTTSGTSIYNVTDNLLQDVGRVASGGTLASGILFVAGTNTAGMINVHGNSIRNTSTVYAAFGVNGTMNAGGGLVYGNVVNNVTTPFGYSGTGVSSGLSCSGTPSASFTSVGGVVTHC